MLIVSFQRQGDLVEGEREGDLPDHAGRGSERSGRERPQGDQPGLL